ncbi:MAG TPA: discoidin domain-containing protein [Polyangia bacterium]|nr:discoidin domain-containing protein [Polyangia bacterium]
MSRSLPRPDFVAASLQRSSVGAGWMLVLGVAFFGCDLPLGDEASSGDQGAVGALAGATATASSVEKAGLEASKAIDGNSSTRWSSMFSDPQWLQIDFGSSRSIDHVTLQWEAAFGADYQLQTSNNASAWTTVRSVTNGDGGTDDFTGLGAHGRFLRIFGTRRGTQWGYSLFEVQVSAASSGGGSGGSSGGGSGGASGGACSNANDPLKTGDSRTDAFDCTIISLANQNGFPDPMMIKSQVALESDFDQFAVSPDSPCGDPAGWTDAESKSFGLTQVTPACGESNATKLPNGHPNLTRDQTSPLWSTSVFNATLNLNQGVLAITNFWNAVKREHAGCTDKQYLLMAAGAYNSGEDSVTGCQQFNDRAQNYVNNVLSRYRNFAGQAGVPFPF